MSASVPLEFDEEDESRDIPDRDGGSCSRGTSQGGADSSASPSVSTPATSAHPLDDEDIPVGKMDGKGGVQMTRLWFDDILVVGFLDEEHEQEQQGKSKSTLWFRQS